MATKKSVPVKPLSGSNYIILLLLAALIGLGLTALVSKALIGSIIVQNKVWSAKRTANTVIDQNLLAAPQLVSAYANLNDATRTKINNSLPTTDDFPNLIAQLENMSRSTGVALVEVSRSTSTTAGTATVPASSASGVTPQAFPVSLSVTGSFTAVQQFIAATEKSARPIKVSSMQLAGSAGAITAQIEATTFYQDAATIPYKLEDLKK